MRQRIYIDTSKTFGILISIFFNALTFHSCNSPTKITLQNPNNIIDTSYLKTIKWDSLNAYVDFHILNEGEHTGDTSLQFSVRPIAVYYYVSKSFGQIDEDTTWHDTKRDLKQFLCSDKFSDKTNLDCLLKINSQINFNYRPDLLRSIFIEPKNNSNESVNSLMSELSKENFAQSVSSEPAIQTAIDTLMRDTTKSIFIHIKLDSAFWSLEKIKDICSQLQKRPNVHKAFFTDFFTGLNESEMFYRLTTKDRGQH